MTIEDKHLLLINKLIYDTRSQRTGIITSIEIMPLCTHEGLKYAWWYLGKFTPRYHDSEIVFPKDIRSNTIKFLIPSGPAEPALYRDKTLEDLKEYFGSEFSEEYIIEMPEEARQEQIRKYERIWTSLSNWNEYFENN